MLSQDLTREYQLLVEEAGFVQLDSPTILKMTGSDRRKFLHNFCTADINGLADGSTTEAFVLNEKGKILAFVNVLALPERLELITAPSQFDLLFQHLDRFNFRDDVVMEDNSAERISYFICGDLANDRMAGLIGRKLAKNEACVSNFGAGEAVIANVELAGFGYFVHVPRVSPLGDVFEKHEIRPCSNGALQIVRLENATPEPGRDVSEENLPQELHRDDKAISFTKGCYLGQETVARIDAMGHVNRLLVSLKLSADCAPGTELFIDEKKVGQVTSVAWSPKHTSWIGLGFVRRNSIEKQLNYVSGEDRGVAVRLDP